jgi:hypothetical protein
MDTELAALEERFVALYRAGHNCPSHRHYTDRAPMLEWAAAAESAGDPALARGLRYGAEHGHWPRVASLPVPTVWRWYNGEHYRAPMADNVPVDAFRRLGATGRNTRAGRVSDLCCCYHTAAAAFRALGEAVLALEAAGPG